MQGLGSKINWLRFRFTFQASLGRRVQVWAYGSRVWLTLEHQTPDEDPNIGALIIRIGFWGPVHYILVIRNPQNKIV